MFIKKFNPCKTMMNDWLDVMLTAECNGSCSFCIEKNGYKPSKKASVEQLIKKAIESDRPNIMLLGGEPTLYKDLDKLILALIENGKRVYLTTNGSLLTEIFARKKQLNRLNGINISLHSQYKDNEKITGISLDNKLKYAIEYLNEQGVYVRFNCNLIKGYVDNFYKARAYLDFAKYLGANKVRFAELKDSHGEYVDHADMHWEDYGVVLSKDPYLTGCCYEIKIRDMPVQIRQMCGLNNPHKPYPLVFDRLASHKVLYYDGEIYDGWQKEKKEGKMNKQYHYYREPLEDTPYCPYCGQRRIPRDPNNITDNFPNEKFKNSPYVTYHNTKQSPLAADCQY